MRTNTDLVYGEHNLSDLLLVEDISLPVMAPRRNRAMPIEGVDGIKLLKQTRDAYRIAIRCRIEGSSREDSLARRRVIAGKLASVKSVVPLQYRHETLKEMAILDGETEGRWDINHLVFDLIFLCPYGCKFGEEKSQTGSGILTLNVGGSLETPPIITVTNAPVLMSVQHLESEKKIAFGKTTGTSKNVKIDMGKRKIWTTDGVQDLREFLSQDSRWFDLVPGENKITVNGGTVKVEWTERWA